MKLEALLAWRFEHPFAPLLVGLLVFHVASPLIVRSPFVSLALTILLLMTCVPAIRPSRRLRIAAIAGLAIVTVVRAAAIGSGGGATALHVAGLLVTAAYVAIRRGERALCRRPPHPGHGEHHRGSDLRLPAGGARVRAALLRARAELGRVHRRPVNAGGGCARTRIASTSTSSSTSA